MENDKHLEESGENDGTSNSDIFTNNPSYVENPLPNNEELSNSSDLGKPPLPQSVTPSNHDKAYFDELFDWCLIEQRLKEFGNLCGQQKQSRDEDVPLKDQNTLCSKPSVKLRDKQSSVPRSEAERKRRSKDLLQNRRSTGFLSFEDVEKTIKEIEEIGATIQESLQNNNEHLEDTETIRNQEDITKGETNIEDSEYSPVKLREKKSSSPFNSAASRKRRSRNLLLNRRSTGYVSVEDVEKAKSMDPQDDDEDDGPVLNN